MLNLQRDSLEWAIAHATKFGDTDVFPVPFEYEAIDFDKVNIVSFLSGSDLHNWATRPHRTLLSPKAKYGFRVITQLDPLDFILFAAAIYEVANDFENIRVPITEDRVFSYRVSLNNQGQLFDPDIGYREFIAECTQKVHDHDGNYVATADISDFYPRIYHHRLENALQNATTKSAHVKGIMRLLSGWNGTETFGIPVGGAPSRILAEVTLSDIDEALLSAGIDFIRFNDDYRIFADSYSEAYRHIAVLAETLYRNHGLSLQPQKTGILDIGKFSEKYLSTPLDRELDSLHSIFEALVATLGLGSSYDVIEYDDLPAEQKSQVDSMNLHFLFDEEIGKEEPEAPIIKFILRRLGQLGDDAIVEPIFNNLEKLHPVLPDIVHYFENLRHLTPANRSALGTRIIGLIEGSILSELTYHRMWLLDLFTHSQEWDNEGRFFNLYATEPDPACRRSLILAMGRAHRRHWFQSQWRSLFDHPSWPRRALLAAASCMPTDARSHWYRSVEAQLDPLEKAVSRWARQNPF